MSLIAGIALAGCTGGGGSATGDSGTGSTDTLTLALNGPPLTFDPARADNGNGVIYTQLAYEPLIRAASDGSLEPGLATEWEYVGEGNKEFRLTLRDGAQFSDGTPVTSDAVAASLTYYVQNASGPSAIAVAGLTAAADGPDSVVLTSENPNPVLPELLTQTNLVGSIISPAGLQSPDSLQATPAGAGPYVLDADRTVSGDTYTYTANPDFWDESQQEFATIVVKVIPSTTSALQALRTGQVDFITGTPQTVDTAKSAGLQVFNSPATWEGLFLLDRGGELVPALGDVRVRQALNYAIDRESIATALFGDYGTPTDQPTTAGWDGYDESLQGTYPYDPDKARELLAQAGYGAGFTLPVNYFAVGATEAVMQTLASQLSDVGVTLELKPNPDITSYVPDLTSKQYAASSLTFAGQPQFINVAQCWLPTSVLNPFGVSDPAFTSLYQQAAAASGDDAETLMKQTMATVVEDAYTLPVVQSDVIYFAREGLDGIELGPTGGRVNPLDWTA
jgi:ABC-type transport system substrate-binding protein